MTYLLVFVASGVVVVFAGTALARYGDAIAEATKIGRVWIGAVLLAGATSLPELATDIAAVRLGAVDLAVEVWQAARNPVGRRGEGGAQGASPPSWAARVL